MQAECAGGFSEPQVASPRLRVDSLLRSFPPASSPLACDDRPLRHFAESLASDLLLIHGRSSVSGHGCHALVVGLPSDLCLPSFWFDPSGSGQGPAITGSGAHADSSFLDSTPLVPRPSGDFSRNFLLPATKEGSTQTAAFPPLPSEPPRASADCVSFVE